MFRYILLFISVFSCIHARAQYEFDYNTLCREAYTSYMSLDLEKGSNIIQQEISANPANLMAIYVADYEDLFVLLFNGSKQDFNKRKHHLDERLKMLSKGDKNNPWYKVTKAGIYMHWALIYFRMGEHYKAATTFRKSYLLVKENQKLFPDFYENNFFLGIGETVIGTLPDEYKWIVALFGMKGKVQTGMGKLAKFIHTSAPGDVLHNEAVIFHSYLQFYLQSKQEATWRFVNSAQFPVNDNPLHAFIKANLALNYRKAGEAFETLQQVQNTTAFQQFPAFEYEMGSALLHQLHPDAAAHFIRFIQKDEGKLFVKKAYMLLAHHYYIHGNMTKANIYRKKIANNGNTITDADKEALRFSQSTNWPAVVVLKARYLVDGGFYQQTLHLLEPYDLSSLSSMSDKLEYFYRSAKAYEETDRTAKAIAYYKTTIKFGRERKEHFAARAALQLGLMYEKQGKTATAIAMYKDCLSMKNHDFQSNIDQQAKAGLNRLQ